jgi:zinc protease
MNRQIAPIIQPPASFPSLKVAQRPLKDGRGTLWSLQGGREPVFRLEWLFSKGEAAFGHPVLPGILMSLLGEGVKGRSAQEFHFALESMGARLERQASRDYLSVAVSGLTRHLPALLPLMEELVWSSIFPEKEIARVVEQELTGFRIQQKQVDWQARTAARKHLFQGHAYGIQAEEKDFEDVDQASILLANQALLNQIAPDFMFSGGFTTEDLSFVTENLSHHVSTSVVRTEEEVGATDPVKLFVPVEGALQSAIVMGLKAPSRTSEDYAGFRFLTTLFGGYFGSRLMKNIREEKGYTYGIGSGITDTRAGSFMFIQTEVGAEMTEATLTEIEHEMKRLRDELVPSSEMDIVKNYLSGGYLRSLDGPFRQAAKVRNAWLLGENEAQDRFVMEAMMRVTPEELKRLAEQYFHSDLWVTAVAGPPSAKI